VKKRNSVKPVWKTFQTMTPKQQIDSTYECAKEMLADIDVENDFKFNFDFKRYFPEKGVLVFPDVVNVGDKCNHYKGTGYRHPTKGYCISCTLIYTLAGCLSKELSIEGDKRGDINDPYYMMQAGLHAYHEKTAYMAYRLGKYSTQAEILKWIKKNSSKSFYEEFQSYLKATDLLNDMRKEDNIKILQLQIQLKQKQLEGISDTDKNKFIAIVKQAKRTKEGKLVWSDVSRKAKKELPNGINGRKLDDKYCKELVEG
jgi:hypothetical protein